MVSSFGQEAFENIQIPTMAFYITVVLGLTLPLIPPLADDILSREAYTNIRAFHSSSDESFPRSEYGERSYAEACHLITVVSRIRSLVTGDH
jgi:hypothetical protein